MTKNPQQGGGGAVGVQFLFKSRDVGSAALHIGDLGGHPPHGKGHGGGSVLGIETPDGAAPAEET